MVTQKNKSLNSLADTGIAYDDVLLVPQYSTGHWIPLSSVASLGPPSCPPSPS